MKTYFLAFFLLVNYALLAQAGIHTQSPKATLHVVGKPGVTTSMDGIIAPKLTGNQLNNKTYTSQQDGALVYVTSPLTNANKGQCANVKASGYYFFNNTKWDKLESNTKMATLADVDIATRVPKKGDRLVYNGTKWVTDPYFYVHVGNNDWRKYTTGLKDFINNTFLDGIASSFNASNGSITVPYAGFYRIIFKLRAYDLQPAGTNIGIGVLKNSSLMWFDWRALTHSNPNTHNRTTLITSKILKLNAGDTLKTQIYVDDDEGIIFPKSYFTVYKL